MFVAVLVGCAEESGYMSEDWAADGAGQGGGCFGANGLGGEYHDGDNDIGGEREAAAGVALVFDGGERGSSARVMSPRRNRS